MPESTVRVFDSGEVQLLENEAMRQGKRFDVTTEDLASPLMIALSTAKRLAGPTEKHELSLRCKNCEQWHRANRLMLGHCSHMDCNYETSLQHELLMSKPSPLYKQMAPDEPVRWMSVQEYASFAEWLKGQSIDDMEKTLLAWLTLRGEI